MNWSSFWSELIVLDIQMCSTKMGISSCQPCLNVISSHLEILPAHLWAPLVHIAQQQSLSHASFGSIAGGVHCFKAIRLFLFDWLLFERWLWHSKTRSRLVLADVGIPTRPCQFLFYLTISARSTTSDVSCNQSRLEFPLLFKKRYIPILG